MSNYYEILNVNKNASLSEIKAAYKKLALKHHPDKCKPEEREANENEFKKINLAYETLSDDSKRKDYDLQQSLGGMGLGGMGNVGGFNFFNFFEQNEQMYNINLTVNLTLYEVYTGTVKSVNYSKTVACDTCSCKGYLNQEDVNTCTSCNGTGFIDQVIQMGFLRQILKNQCNSCKGKGTIILKPCQSCKGNKTVLKDVSVNLKFPKGIKNGDSINLNQKGNYYVGGNYTTDLLITVHIEPHPIYTRMNNDLTMTLNITLVEALKGFTKTVKFIDDTDLEIVSTSILNPSSVMTLPNKGIKNGSLIIKFNIEFPTDLQEFKNHFQ